MDWLATPTGLYTTHELLRIRAAHLTAGGVSEEDSTTIMPLTFDVGTAYFDIVKIGEESLNAGSLSDNGI